MSSGALLAALLLGSAVVVLPSRGVRPRRTRRLPRDEGPVTVEDAASALALVAAALRGGGGSVEALEHVSRAMGGGESAGLPEPSEGMIPEEGS